MKKKKKLTKIIIAAICAAILFFTGFYYGRKTLTSKTEIRYVDKYITLPAIHDTISKLTPFKVIQPVDTFRLIQRCIEDGIYVELFPEKIVEKEIYLTSEDTIKIVEDWAAKRLYSEILFDSDTIGSMRINAEIQYNRINNIGYTFIPIQKQAEIIESNKIVNKYEPFLGIGISTMGYGKAELGLYFMNHYGFSFEYEKSFNNDDKNYGLNIKYKF